MLSEVGEAGFEGGGMRKELQNMSITDELTGLYNRRGLLILGQEMLKMEKRSLLPEQKMSGS